MTCKPHNVTSSIFSPCEFLSQQSCFIMSGSFHLTFLTKCQPCIKNLHKGPNKLILLTTSLKIIIKKTVKGGIVTITVCLQSLNRVYVPEASLYQGVIVYIGVSTPPQKHHTPCSCQAPPSSPPPPNLQTV